MTPITFLKEQKHPIVLSFFFLYREAKPMSFLYVI